MAKIIFNIPDGDKCNDCRLRYMGYAGRTQFDHCVLHLDEVLPDEKGNIYKCERCLNCDYDNFNVEEYYKSFMNENQGVITCVN